MNILSNHSAQDIDCTGVFNSKPIRLF